MITTFKLALVFPKSRKEEDMLYLSEHQECRNYEGGKRPAIEYKAVRRGEKIESQFTENKIIFLLKGCFCVNCGKYDDYFSEGHFMVIPAGTPYRVEAQEDTEYIVYRISNNLHLCGEFSLEKLFQDTDENSRESKPLPFCEAMQLYVRMVTYYLLDGISCLWFFEIKMKELMFILRNYYSKDDLRQFFSPLLSDDLHFSDFVIKNHRRVKNVKEFAELANYSVSGFEKKFKKVFHVSAYRWMKEQKAKELLHEIHINAKSFKEIGWEYGFSSPAQFNDFCKANFGMTPGQLRNSVVKSED